MPDPRVIPHEGPRVESGPVQIGDDWPGLFLRGDDACDAWLLLSRCVEQLGPDLPWPADAARLADLARLLRSGFVGKPGEESEG